MKKRIALFFALLIAISAFCLFSFGAYAAEEGGFTYSVSNGKATVTGASATLSGSVVIPDTLGGYPVTAIASHAFLNCTKITSVILPDGITVIGESAFGYCSSLESINIPSNVTNIDSYAFRYCKKLESVTFTSGALLVGNSAFSGCNAIRKVNAPDIETWCNIGFGEIWSNPLTCSSNAKLYLNGIAVTGTITVPGGVAAIPNGAFANQYDITDVYIPDSVTSIGDSAFSCCTGIESIIIPNNVTVIESDTFKNCIRLETVYLPDSIQKIQQYAFDNCSAIKKVHVPTLEAWLNINMPVNEANPLYYSSNAVLLINGEPITGEVTIPKGTVLIPAYTFRNCTGITKLSVPDTVNTIKKGAFLNCVSTERVDITDLVKWCNITFENLESNPLYTSGAKLYINGKELSGKIVVPEGAEHIPAGTFAMHTEITEIILPESVTAVGTRAFAGCSKLKSIQFGHSVSAMSLGDKLYIYLCFEGCYSLESITSSGDSGSTGITGNCILNGNILLFGCKGAIIPENTKTINTYAFYNCKGLTEIVIPDNVTTINKYAFSGCTDLKSLTLGQKLKSFDHTAFLGCTALESLNATPNSQYYYSENNCIIEKETNMLALGCKTSVIPDTVTAIGSYSFYGCTQLTDLYIPKGVAEIKPYAFAECKNLSSITVSPLNPKLYSQNNCVIEKNSLTVVLGCKTSVIPDNAKKIGVAAFYRCTDLESINVPASITSIGAYAFNGCNKLESLTVSANNSVYYAKGNCIIEKESGVLAVGCNTSVIPEGIKAIGVSAFGEYNGIKNIIIPNGTEIIENDAFYMCPSLSAVYLPHSLRYVGNRAFNGCSSVTTLEIPAKVTYIGAYAFSETAISNAEIPASTTYIGEYAFAYCEYLMEVLIQGSPEIGKGAFLDCGVSPLLADFYTPCVILLEPPAKIDTGYSTLPSNLAVYILTSDTVTPRTSRTRYLHDKETCVFDRERVSLAAVCTPGSCTEKAEYYLSCACGRISGKDTFTGDYFHIFTAQSIKDEYKASNADCKSAALYYFSCEHCGEKSDLTFEYGEKLSHSFTKQDVSTEYLVSAMTCTEKAVYYYCCELCGKCGSETFEYGDPNHTPGGKLYYNSKTHYEKCTVCEERLNVTEHSYGTDSICTDCGYLEGAGLELTVKAVSHGKENEKMLIELIPEGDTDAAYTEEISNTSAEYTFASVTPGEYTLRVSKTKHVTREYKVTVGEKDTVKVLLRLYGDVDNNGKINAADATQIKRYYNNKASVFDSVSGEELEYLQKAADVNGDNKANASDATQIKRFYNNKTSVFTNIP